MRDDPDRPSHRLFNGHDGHDARHRVAFFPASSLDQLISSRTHNTTPQIECMAWSERRRYHFLIHRRSEETRQPLRAAIRPETNQVHRYGHGDRHDPFSSPEIHLPSPWIEPSNSLYVRSDQEAWSIAPCDVYSTQRSNMSGGVREE